MKTLCFYSWLIIFSPVVVACIFAAFLWHSARMGFLIGSYTIDVMKDD